MSAGCPIGPVVRAILRLPHFQSFTSIFIAPNASSVQVPWLSRLVLGNGIMSKALRSTWCSHSAVPSSRTFTPIFKRQEQQAAESPRTRRAHYLEANLRHESLTNYKFARRRNYCRAVWFWSFCAPILCRCQGCSVFFLGRDFMMAS